MEKINEETQDEVTTLKKFKTYPPGFYKTLTSLDDYVTISLPIVVYSFVNLDPCYKFIDTWISDNYFSISTLLSLTTKWQVYCSTYQFFKICGLDVTVNAHNLVSPFASPLFPTTVYPAMGTCLTYQAGVPALDMPWAEMVNHETFHLFPPNYGASSHAFVLPNPYFGHTAEWTPWASNAGLNLYMYVGGQIAQVQSAVTEAYQFTVKIYIGLKNRGSG
jgi:hypothetical protein